MLTDVEDLMMMRESADGFHQARRDAGKPVQNSERQYAEVPAQLQNYARQREVQPP